jgi:oxygen-independent coproporphyrinogen-3 oxidase
MTHVETEQAKAETAPRPGLYMHVPFCASTCDFCAFYQIKPSPAAMERYLAGVERELELIEPARTYGTVFWGGGTPGLLTVAQLRRLGGLVVKHLGGRRATEWTVELAPGSVTSERLEALLEMGVTRVSLGVQSFQPRLLDALGRQHNRGQIDRAYERVRSAGFASVNLDLMFALPGQEEEEWLADIDTAAALQPDHLSTYCLTFEEDTALWVKLSQGRVKLDPEREAQLYETTWARLAERGFAQYEVSNFARPGHACRHNLNTWHMHEWVGIGPSAASQHDGWRGQNVSDLDAWAAAVDRGERLTGEKTRLSPALLAEDALIFGLRMNAGVDLARWQGVSPEAPWAGVNALLDRMAADGLALREGKRVRLTDRGRLLADSIGAEVMEAFSVEFAISS